MTKPIDAIKHKALLDSHLATQPDLFDNPDTWATDPRQAYAAWLESQSLRQSTKTVYLAMFSRFCQWLSESGKSLFHCEVADIARFLDTPNPNTGRVPQPQTGRQRQQYVRQLERVFNHIAFLGRNVVNPGRQAAIERIGAGEDKPTRVLTVVERETVIAALASQLARLEADCAGPEMWMAYRDIALVAVFLGAGLKVSSIERLTLNCMDFEDGRVELSGPHYTHRARLLPFAIPPLAAWLKVLAERHGGTIPEKHPIFEADRSVGFGRYAKAMVMHPSSVHRRTQRFLEEAGITGERASAQTLRNTYASLLIEAGATDDELVDFLGLKASISARRLRKAVATVMSAGEAGGRAEAPRGRAGTTGLDAS